MLSVSEKNSRTLGAQVSVGSNSANGGAIVTNWIPLTNQRAPWKWYPQKPGELFLGVAGQQQQLVLLIAAISEPGADKPDAFVRLSGAAAYDLGYLGEARGSVVAVAQDATFHLATAVGATHVNEWTAGSAVLSPDHGPCLVVGSHAGGMQMLRTADWRLVAIDTPVFRTNCWRLLLQYTDGRQLVLAEGPET